MATTYTTNYNLGKQENHADKFDMDVITDNADKIDAALTGLQSGIDGKQAALTTEQLAAVNSGITDADVAQIGVNKNNILSLQRAHASQTFVFSDLTWTATGGGAYVSNGTSITGIDKIESIIITGFNNIRPTDIISAITTNDRTQVRFMSNVATFAHANSGFVLYITGTQSTP